MADDKPQNADFIGRVVSDAKNPPETRMLTGWFGDSGEEGYRRLYLDAELNSYVDIPDDAILYTEPLRDVQPAGGVIVWIKRDAALKQGGTAASRAARFLQGQVQQDFSASGGPGDTPAENVSPEKAGFRCVTQVPCAEPTGFTGQCTKQPDVGGAWPCITAIPHCFEVTGFTGKCTHAPWPNPTHYIGCTFLHCPTQDLTHIPHICNIVATGNPGCVVINPPQEGGDPALKAEAAGTEAKELPATHIPGCGYTQSWGVCETHLLGCGYTKEWGNQCPTQLLGCGETKDCPTQAPGCGWSKNPVCTDLPGCNWTKQPAICNQNAADAEAFGAPGGGGGAGQPSILCATNIACDVTLFCHTRFWQQCFQTPVCPTRFQPQCFPIPSPFCPVTPGCPFGPGGGGDPVFRGGNVAAFGAAAPLLPTVPATPCNPSQACDTKPPTALCTPDAQFCPTFCGPDCQTKQPHPVCTSVNCLTKVDPQCSPSNMFHDCTSIGSTCPTKGQPGCPTVFPCQNTQNPPVCNFPNVAGAQAFGAAAPRPIGQTQIGCPPSDLVACSLFGGCPSAAQQIGAAGRPIPICTQGGPQCPTHLLGCTQFGPQCHTQPNGDCTFFGCPSRGIDCTVVVCTHVGPLCPPNTAATVCTQTGPQCPPHPSLQGQFCPVTELCPVTPLCQVTHLCPITNGGPQCPVHTGFNCPSALGCQSVACQSIACQPGGGGEQEFGAAQAAPGGIHPTIWTQIGPQCAPSHLLGCTQFTPQCRTVPNGDCTFFGCPSRGIDCTVVVCTHVGPQCPPRPSLGGQFCPVTELCPVTHLCPVTPLCQVTQLCPITTGGPQCPVHSGFNCPSAIGCQSIACQSIACQPGGGGEQQVFVGQHGVPVPQQTQGVLCTQVGPQCPTQQLSCTQFGPQCPNSVAGCTQFGALCPPPSQQGFCPPATSGGPHCPPVSGNFGCPSAHCQSVACQPQGGGGAFAQQAVGAPQTLATVCTQFPEQCRHTQFGQCPSPGIDCTVIICTRIGPLCPPTHHQGCTQPPQCPKPTAQCHTIVGPQCQIHTIQGPGCPITINGPQCPQHTGFNCPSQFGCQSIACQSIACHPGGGGEQQQRVGLPNTAICPNTQVCPTRLGCTQAGPQCPTHFECTMICTHLGPQCPSVGIACTQTGPQCPSHFECTMFCTHAGPQCPSLGIACTQTGPQCPSHFECTMFCTQSGPQCPSLGIACTQTGLQCPPHPSLQGQFCPITNGAPQCPVASGFNCPSQVGCQSIACGQSIACVSVACQPGGGGQQEFAAFGAAPAAAGGGGGGIGVTAWDDCTHFGWQCPPFFTQFEQECVVQPVFTFGPQCLPQTVGCPPPPPPTPFCPSHHFVICTAFGPQCPPPHTQLCPITTGGPQCPPASGFNCPPTHICPSPACPSVAHRCPLTFAFDCFVAG